MHVVVLIKQVLDPEIPARAFRVDRLLQVPNVDRAPYVMSVFDGNALEVALKLREAKGGDVKITAVSLGPKGAEEMLRKALALTADAAVLINAEANSMDSMGKAKLLAAAIRTLDAVDLILAGRQAADWEAGQVGVMVAEELGLPCVPFVSRINPDGGSLKLRRELDDGYQTIRLPGPAVLTITNDETNVLRSAKVKDVMMAARKPLTTLSPADLGFSGEAAADPAIETLDLTVPEPRKRAEMIEGENLQAGARALARRLLELGAL
ncbi:MAG: electron transfer flavoprotein subunit beta/FixA family protein [Firmicutes bacterium]|nr:electron transfer flavoprotein subunit beta/FixA family protein [Bacillota bacterium]